MNVMTKMFCVGCLLLCAACDGGQTVDAGSGNGGSGKYEDTMYDNDKTIGGYNSGYNMHNFMGENPTFITDYTNKDTQAKSAAKSANVYLKEAEDYTKYLANEFEKSLEGRPAAKNYFANLINAMKTNNNFHIDEQFPGGQNVDVAGTVNARQCEPIFANIIKNLDNTDERDAFEICYRILANESYKEGLGSYRNVDSPLKDNYQAEQETLVNYTLSNEEFKKNNIDLANIYQQNKSIKFTPITDLTTRLLGKAKTNINNKQNLDLQVSDLQQFVNISLTAYSLEAMHDYSANALQHKSSNCVFSIRFTSTMQKASEEAWKEEQQYQQAYQDYLSR